MALTNESVIVIYMMNNMNVPWSLNVNQWLWGWKCNDLYEVWMIYMLKWFGIVIELQWLLTDVGYIYVRICCFDMKWSYIRNDKGLTYILMKVLIDTYVGQHGKCHDSDNMIAIYFEQKWREISESEMVKRLLKLVLHNLCALHTSKRSY